MVSQCEAGQPASGHDTDVGTGYGRKLNRHDPLLTEVDPGTAMGELLRRYWQPIAASAELGTDKPQRVRLLGEDLVLFRDGEGRPGLVIEQCCHRGTSLFFGRLEADGIRCCYHGWKFDVKGRCLDMGCEVDGGGKGRSAIRQPWYPVQERYGAIWAYLGPPEVKPALPRWAVLENLEEDEFYEVWPHYDGYGHGDALDYNWLQSYENTVDSLHAVWLHIAHGYENQFGNDRPFTPEETHGIIRQVDWRRTERGVVSDWTQPVGPGVALSYAVENMMPNVTCVPNYVNQNRNVRQDQIMWHVPVDNTHFKIFQIGRVKVKGDLLHRIALHKGKHWRDCSPEELRISPGDYEAQSTQGKIAVHANEHLSRTDKGVVLTRRLLREQIDIVAAGGTPMNLVFAEDAAPLETAGGQKIITTESAAGA